MQGRWKLAQSAAIAAALVAAGYILLMVAASALTGSRIFPFGEGLILHMSEAGTVLKTLFQCADALSPTTALLTLER